MATQVILLERVDNLGEMGDVVAVKPGYARNFLLPQKKALRASKDNVAYFETQKKALQAESDKRRKAAEATAKKIDGLKVPLIRQASEAGQLFGSVNARDIAAEVTAVSKEQVDRSQVILNQNYKSIGLFEVEITLHPEVKVLVTINIARSPEEAEIQAETGKALVADAPEDAPIQEQIEEAEAQLDEALEDVLEEGALEAEKEKQAAASAKAAEEEAKAQAQAEEKAAAEKAKKAEEEAVAAEASEGDVKPEEKAEDAPEEEPKE